MGIVNEEKIKKTLDFLTPNQQAFVKAVVTMKIENKVLRKQIADLRQAYDDAWKIMIVILSLSPGKELRIHESQFLRFKEEYRIDKTFDEEKKEVVVRLLTVNDPMPS